MITDTHLIYCCKQLVHSSTCQLVNRAKTLVHVASNLSTCSLVNSSTKLKTLVHVASNLSTCSLVNSSTKLKFLSKDKVELATTLCTKYLVETISPVDTHHTHHW